MKQHCTSPLIIVIVALAAIAAFIPDNHVLDPDIMEARNLIAAREMVEDGHWMVPTLNGNLRLEKPPLPTWLTAVTYYVSADSLTLQRGMAGLAALLLVFYFWRFARRVLDTDPLPSTLLLLTCYSVILMGRTATWDIYCHAFQMAGIYHLARGLQSRDKALRQFLAAGVWTGLSILSKGPVSPYALLLPFLIAVALVDKPRMRGKWTGVALMTITALATGTWWFIYIRLSQAEAMAAVVAKESGAWINHNTRPWWYYWKFFLEAGIWAVFLLTAIFLPLFQNQRRKERAWLLPCTWMVFSLILLSLMPEKKPRYLLPMLIPASLVMGQVVVWWQHKPDARALRLNSGLLAVAIAALPVLAWTILWKKGIIGWEFGAGLTAVCLAGVVALYRAARHLLPMPMLWAVLWLFCFIELAGMPVVKQLVNNPHAHSLALIRQEKPADKIPLRHDERDDLRPELVYAAGRCIKPLDVTRTDSLLSALPCVLLTRKSLAESLPAEVYASLDSLGIDTLYIDTYDNNQRPPGNKRHSQAFVTRATLLTHKNQ